MKLDVSELPLPNADNLKKIHFLKSKLSETQLKFAFSLLKSDDVAKLVGIMSHFVYWSVFGGFNQLQIDNYHMDKMLRSILD